MAGVTVSDNRRAYDAIMREVKRMGRATVTIGIHGDAGQHREAEGMTVAQIGAVHEFGTAEIPERSFLRATVDGDATIAEYAENQVREVATGKTDATKAANRIGLVAVGAVKRRIQTRIPPPLSEATRVKRTAKAAHGGGLAGMGGAQTPLIDSGQLIQSIQYRAEV